MEKNGGGCQPKTITMLKTILKAGLLGVLIALLAVLLEQLLAAVSQYYFNQEAVLPFYDRIGWFLIAAITIEEGLKYASIQYALPFRQNIRGKNLVAASFFLGFFFGLTEIGLILVSIPEAGSLVRNFESDMLFSLLSILLIQTVTAFLMGSLVAAEEKKNILSPFKILFFPLLIHLLYNFLIIQKGDFTSFLVTLTLFIAFVVSLVVTIFNLRRLS